MRFPLSFPVALALPLAVACGSDAKAPTLGLPDLSDASASGGHGGSASGGRPGVDRDGATDDSAVDGGTEDATLAAGGSTGDAAVRDAALDGRGGTLADAALADRGAVVDASAPDAAPSLSPGYALVYSGIPMGIDLRSSVSAAFDGSGRMTRYFFSENEHLWMFEATLTAASGSDGTAAWGTWVNGPTSGVFYGGTPRGNFTFAPAQNGFHHAIGKLATNVPVAGRARYALVGATAPTASPGTAPGTLQSATLVVDFAGGRVAVEAAGSTASGSFAIATAGGVAIPGNSQVGMLDATTFSGDVASGFSLRGALVGDGASELIVAYLSLPEDPDTGPEVRGAFVAERSGTVPEAGAPGSPDSGKPTPPDAGAASTPDR